MGRATRRLIITADDFGIGPETSRGILDLAARGVVTSTVMLVTSPHAEDGVRQWRAAGAELEVGWHPCLTLDRPILPPERVPSLVGPDGALVGLGGFLKRMVFGKIDAEHVEAEFAAQLGRFVDLVGRPPATVNAHHHVHVFPAVGAALRKVLSGVTPRPFVRRVVEPAGTLARVPNARLKRLALTAFGRVAAGCQRDAGFPGADVLAGVTDPPFVRDPRFFLRWLETVPGDVVELTCHPGHLDPTLIGRDGTLADGQLHRRVNEFERLASPAFLEAVSRSGFTPGRAAEIAEPAVRDPLPLPTLVRAA